jgi:hypothetical protein
MTDTVRAQIDTLRESGRCYMLDILSVFEAALAMDLDELADLVFMDTPRYSAYIMTGERE